MTDDREWWPDAALGAVVGLIALLDTTDSFSEWTGGTAADFLVIIGLAVAVGLFRRSPGTALAVAWLTFAVQAANQTLVMPIEIALMLVAFGAGRWGSPFVVWISGLSIPAVAFLTYGLISSYGSPFYDGLGVPASQAISLGIVGRATLVVMGVLILSAPWLVGLLVRSRAREQESAEGKARAEAERMVAEAGRARAQEIATLRADQARLANDVHDVVGHSLAVILAQAESAQFLPKNDTARVRATLENVAESARQSLQDVRRVLSVKDGEAATITPAGGLDSLIDGVSAAGDAIESKVIGNPQPLPPELDVVAYRVLQEMLTNALKHGKRGETIEVERHWDDDLRIEVRNVIRDDAPALDPLAPAPMGLVGMRTRLEAVGGRLDVRRRDEPDRPTTFTATAWVPVRAGSA